MQQWSKQIDADNHRFHQKEIGTFENKVKLITGHQPELALTQALNVRGQPQVQLEYLQGFTVGR